MSAAAPPDLVARLRAAGCVLAEEEAALLVAAAGSSARLEELVDRRVAGAPLEVVLGRAERYGVVVGVAEGVFVPRHRSALLVEEAVRRARPGSVVVDLCCGTGALGLAVATRVAVELHAVDIDPVAVRCARENLATVGGSAYAGDLDAPLPGRLQGRVDLLLASPPYVPTGEVGLLPREARLHEPPHALDGGGDGLDVLRRIAAAAPRWLAPDGVLLLESGAHQVAAAVDVLVRQGFAAGSVTDEDAAVVVGARAGAQTPMGARATAATSCASPSRETSACSLRP